MAFDNPINNDYVVSFFRLVRSRSSERLLSVVCCYVVISHRHTEFRLFVIGADPVGGQRITHPGDPSSALDLTGLHGGVTTKKSESAQKAARCHLSDTDGRAGENYHRDPDEPAPTPIPSVGGRSQCPSGGWREGRLCHKRAFAGGYPTLSVGTGWFQKATSAINRRNGFYFAKINNTEPSKRGELGPNKIRGLVA